jgi:hypothetical protein
VEILLKDKKKRDRRKIGNKDKIWKKKGKERDIEEKKEKKRIKNVCGS